MDDTSQKQSSTAEWTRVAVIVFAQALILLGILWRRDLDIEGRITALESTMKTVVRTQENITEILEQMRRERKVPQ